jgi:hypothetical protein
MNLWRGSEFSGSIVAGLASTQQEITMLIGVDIVHPVVKQAVLVLQHGGEIESDGVMLRRIYRDDKLNITAGVAQNMTLDYIAISLNMSEESPAVMETRFGLPPSRDDETIVFYIEVPLQFPAFERPGHWQKYLGSLYNHLLEEQKKAQALNHKPIDDGFLFPDVE